MCLLEYKLIMSFFPDAVFKVIFLHFIFNILNEKTLLTLEITIICSNKVMNY